MNPIPTIEQLLPGEGEVMEVEGEKIAVYKDKQGKITKLSPVCPHMRCEITWNPEEKTWDCPCHGSRFSAEGTVIQGPAVDNLSKQSI